MIINRVNNLINIFRYRPRVMIVAVLAILSVISALYIFSLTSKPTEVSEGGLPAPKIPTKYPGELSINLLVQKDDFKFPSSLPLLKNTPPTPMTAEEAKTIASTFAFTNEPKTATDISEGKTYIWTGEQGNLFVYSKTRRVSYTARKDLRTTKKQLSDDALIAIGADFINKHFAISNINFYNFIFYKGSVNTEDFTPASKAGANIYQVNYTLSVSEYPLLTTNPENSLLYVRILTDGEVLSSVFTDLDELKPTEESYRLKGFDEVNASLDQMELISLDNGNIDIIEVGSDITEINIDNISLAYLFDSLSSDVFQPVYLLSGSAKLKGAREEINAKLYLPAVSKN